MMLSYGNTFWRHFFLQKIYLVHLVILDALENLVFPLLRGEGISIAEQHLGKDGFRKDGFQKKKIGGLNMSFEALFLFRANSKVLRQF